MVRESTSKPGCYALSLRVPRDFQPSGIAHYLIMRTNKGYKIKVCIILTRLHHKITSFFKHHGYERKYNLQTIHFNSKLVIQYKRHKMPPFCICTQLVFIALWVTVKIVTLLKQLVCIEYTKRELLFMTWLLERLIRALIFVVCDACCDCNIPHIFMMFMIHIWKGCHM